VTLAEIVSDKPAESCAALRRADQLFKGAGEDGYEFYAKRAADGAARCATR
jgi:hypothetical protein